MSSCPHSLFRRSNAASVWSSAVTSSSMVRREPSECASGSTRSFIFSFTYENASSAPSRCIACAMPQAIDRSVATPTMKARLPVRKPMFVASGADYAVKACRRDGAVTSAVARAEMDVQLLPGMDVGLRVQAVPGEQLRHAALEQAGNLRHGVTLAHRVHHVPHLVHGCGGAGG